MYGYDIGGAEFPYDPTVFTVVDIADPNEVNHPVDTPRGGYDWIRVDLNNPHCFAYPKNGRGVTIEMRPRPLIVMNKILRYVKPERLRPLAVDVDEIWAEHGTLRLFDYMSAIEPFLESILTHSADTPRTEIREFELINPAWPEDDPEAKAEWTVFLYKH